MPQAGALAGSPGGANTVVEVYNFTVVSTTSTTALTAGATGLTSLTVGTTTGMVVDSWIFLDTDTANEEAVQVTSITSGTVVVVKPRDTTGFKFAHTSGYAVTYKLFAPSSVIRDGTTVGNTLKVNSDGSALARMTDGTNVAAVKAGVIAVTSDNPLVVTMHPSSAPMTTQPVSLTTLPAGTNTIGKTTNTNDATSNTAVAAGTTTAASVVKGSAGRLSHVLVTTAGTAETVIYDNASAASGTIIGIIATTAIRGQVIVFAGQATAGITVGKVNGSAAFTAFYA